MTDRLLTLAQAAEQTPWGVAFLDRACRTTDPHAMPPPLKSKRGPRSQRLVLESELTRWQQSFPDA